MGFMVANDVMMMVLFGNEVKGRELQELKIYESQKERASA